MKRFSILDFRFSIERSKTKNAFYLALGVMLFALCLPAEAQQPKKVPRIAWLTGSTLSSNAHRIEAFRQGLRDLGYVEGKNILIEWRGADGNPDRQPVLVAELLRLEVDLIVTSGGGPTRVAKEATATIPIVFTQDTDPIGNGFVRRELYRLVAARRHLCGQNPERDKARRSPCGATHEV